MAVAHELLPPSETQSAQLEKRIVIENEQKREGKLDEVCQQMAGRSPDVMAQGDLDPRGK